MASLDDDEQHASQKGRLIYRLPVGEKGPRYDKVESMKRSKSGAVTVKLQGESQVIQLADEGEKWAWAAEAHTGLLISKKQSGDVANFAMLASLSKLLFGGKLPAQAKDCVLKFVLGGIARFDVQGSVVRIVDDWVTVTVDLPCLDRYSAGVMAYSSCSLGPEGNCLYLVAKEVLRPGIPDSTAEVCSYMLELKLPMRPGDAAKRLCHITQGDLRNLLDGGTWTSEGVILLGERDGTGNVAQHRSWDGSLIWELEGRSLPKIEWLDSVRSDGVGFLLIGTSHNFHQGCRKVILRWDPLTCKAEDWNFADTLLTLSDKRFPKESQSLRDIVLLPDSTIIYAASGEDEEENDVSVLWRCRLPSLDVMCCVELQNFRLNKMYILPDHRLIVTTLNYFVCLDRETLEVLFRENFVEVDGRNEPWNVGHDPDRCFGWENRQKFINFNAFTQLS